MDVLHGSIMNMIASDYPIRSLTHLPHQDGEIHSVWPSEGNLPLDIVNTDTFTPLYLFFDDGSEWIRDTLQICKGDDIIHDIPLEQLSRLEAPVRTSSDRIRVNCNFRHFSCYGHIINIDRGTPLQIRLSGGTPCQMIYSSGVVPNNSNWPKESSLPLDILDTDTFAPIYLFFDSRTEWTRDTLQICKGADIIHSIPLEFLSRLEAPTITRSGRIRVNCNFKYFSSYGYVMNIERRTPLQIRLLGGTPCQMSYSTGVLSLGCSGFSTDVRIVAPMRAATAFAPEEIRHAISYTFNAPPTRSVSRWTRPASAYSAPTLEFTFGGRLSIVGFVISSSSPLTCFKLYLNGWLRLDLNEFLLENTCHRLDRDTLYISLTGGTIFEQVHRNMVHMVRIDIASVKIETSDPADVTIFQILHNRHDYSRSNPRFRVPNLDPDWSFLDIEMHHLHVYRPAASAPAPAPTSTPRAIASESGESNGSSDADESGANDSSVTWTCQEYGVYVGSLDDVCPISLLPLDISGGICKCIRCHKLFNYPVYRQWIELSGTCPFCRYEGPLRTYYSNSQSS
jgi:hypothetical protein